MVNTYAVVKIISVVIAALSQVLLKISANKKYDNRIKEYLNPLVIIAYGIFGLSMLMGVYSLKGITISLSYVLESLSYILIPILGFMFFKEKLNKMQFIGTLIIIVGVLLYNM